MNVPVWGWPWHGRVDLNSRLHLPNGQTLSYNAPSGGLGFMFTYRVKVPGVAPVLRSPEEAEADAAAGREWRDEAIMGGFNLYGKELGGWIYSAPDGTKWVISIDHSQTGATVPVQAQRFGVLGGKAESRSLQLTWPTDDLINGQPFSQPPYSVMPIRWRAPVDISPDGSRAIFMMYAYDSSAPVPFDQVALFQSLKPIGFQLVTVAGGGDGLQIAATTLRTFEQTMGAAFLENSLTVEQMINNSRVDHTEPRRADINRPYPDPPGTEYWSGVGVNGAYDFDPGGRYEYANGSLSRGVTGRILALWFDPSGEIIECTVRTAEHYVINMPHPTSTAHPDRPGWDMWVRDMSALTTVTWDLLVDEDVVCTYTTEYAGLSSGPMFGASTLTGVAQLIESTTLTRDDGDTLTWDVFTIGNGQTLDSIQQPPSVYSLTYAGGGHWRVLTNNVVVFARYDAQGDSSSGIQYHGCATPRGAFPMSGLVAGQFSAQFPAGPMLNARYNPFTGEVSDPVGDTVTFV